MEEKDFLFPEEFYSAYLTSINEIHFTRREIDVISCLLSARRTSQIASILSIAPRTVTTHFHNIMRRLDCNSQEGIISFIEKSHKLHILREYYASLVVKKAFEASLKEVSKLKHEESPKSLIIYWKNQKVKEHLLSHLVSHLNQAYVKAEVCEYNNDQKIEVGENLHHILLKEEKSNLTSPEIVDFNSVSLSEGQNYYFAVFEILRKLFPQENLTPILASFKARYRGLHTFTESKKSITLSQSTSLRNYPSETLSKIISFSKGKKWLVTSSSLILILGLFGIGFLTFQQKETPTQNLLIANAKNHKKERDYIRSDLIIPTEISFLHRPELLIQMNTKLQDQGEIQAVALVGPGGAGKTTLARHYVHQQKANVVWEINAETDESLKSSFENLAQALAQTGEEKRILRGIQDEKNPEERDRKMILFVKKRLRSHPNWFLIFDNVETFSDIQKYFPLDFKTWGHGKVILTTRNKNIENNKYIGSVVQIRELSPEKKAILFTKIITRQNEPPFTPIQAKEVKAFLEHIPPFPLDVSVAAYYLKTTQIPYATYLENLMKYNKNFENIQKSLLKEAGDYTKTRYGIISLSLEHIINTHKDFHDLLLLISLLDSQNIPREFLERHKNSNVIDCFIYNLKRHSFITSENHVPSLGPVFSLHRSTQDLILASLIKILNSDKREKSLQLIATTLEKYITDAMENEDFLKMQSSICHYEKFLSYTKLSNSETCASIMGKLGFIYAENGEYVKGKQFLEESLRNLKKQYKKNKLIIAKYLNYLGNIYRILGNYDQAQKTFEEALLIFNKYFPENYEDLAQVLIHLSVVYKELGNYEKAEALLEQALLKKPDHFFKNRSTKAWGLTFLGNIYNILGKYEKAREALEQSTIIYKNNCPENNRDFIRTLTHLGSTYGNLGFYEKAKDLLEHSHAMHQELFGDNNVRTSWALAHLGNVYRELGYYDQAKEVITRSLVIHKNHFKESHQRIARLLLNLGNLHLSMRSYEKAKEFLNLSFNIYEKLYGKNHIEIARVLRIRAKLFCEEGNVDLGESYLQKSLKIAQQKNYPDRYMILEDLSDLYMNKFMIEKSKGNSEKACFYKNKAIKYLNQAQSIITLCVLANSPHVVRIQSKLEKIKR